MENKEKRLNSRDVRAARIVAMAANGVPLQTIAGNFDCSVGVVERALFSQEGQKRLKDVMQECEASINNQLPEILNLSLQNLKDVLLAPFASRTEKLRASEIALKTALKLSEITSRA